MNELESIVRKFGQNVAELKKSLTISSLLLAFTLGLLVGSIICRLWG
uniref:Uncharacterized protein n=1 Tax=viral metagenome TaxID=1070528 RepID=A0A6M3LPY0_9ZZZZ